MKRLTYMSRFSRPIADAEIAEIGADASRRNAGDNITARLPIEDVSELVTAYLEACSTGIAACGGEVTKYLGDGVMAYFDPGDVDAALEQFGGCG